MPNAGSDRVLVMLKGLGGVLAWFAGIYRYEKEGDESDACVT